MIKDFKEFITKGNVIDLAVGIIIGAAFTAIVGSFVKDIVTPLIGSLGKASFENVFIVLKPGASPEPYPTLAVAQRVGAITLNLGVFLNAVINFFLVALVVYFIVRAANRFKKKEEAAPVEVPAQELLLIEIRDLLKAQSK